MTPDLRNRIVRRARRFAWDRLGFAPFRHQAEWMLASEGLRLIRRRAQPHSPGALRIRLRDKSTIWVRTAPRVGGPATVIADLAAYKAGKSMSGAMWLAGFAFLDGARVDLVGLEYDIVTPEFDYLIEALLSERGLGLPYVKLHNQPKAGRLLIELKNGARFEGRSWTKKDILKGKERDCYYWAEAYMLPGMSAPLSVWQNLRRRRGFNIFTTTADRPWVAEFHERGHGMWPEWHCTCGIHARENPYTFSQADYDRDHPDKGGLMTREQFAVSWEGKLGDFVGRVYNYQRGQLTFDPDSHPDWWQDPHADPRPPSHP